MRPWTAAGLASAALLLCSLVPAAAHPGEEATAADAGARSTTAGNGPRRVLFLQSFGRDFAPYDAIATAFRRELSGSPSSPVEVLEVSLETARFKDVDEEPVADYIRALCGSLRFDLVILNGQPAARFWQSHGGNLLPDTPTLIGVVEERPLEDLRLSRDEAGVSFRLDDPGLIDNILRLLPETENLFVVVGNSPIERYWIPELRQAWRPFEERLRIIYLNDLPFEEIVDETAELPPRSAILFVLMLVDAVGVPHDQGTTFGRLRRAAGAPIFGWTDDLLGEGIVGGPLIPLDELGRAVGRAARRILEGEDPETVGRSVMGMAGPAYDWRELRRWSISEDRLPPGSTILFRPPSILTKYRWWILAALGIIGAQGVALAALLIARRRRRQAEAEARLLGRELAHAGRVSLLGQLSSSLAHELNQPLGAILRNAEAAELFLAGSPPNLEEVRAILADIRKDDQRAGAVIDGIRALARRHDVEMSSVEPRAIVDAVVALIRPDARARNVTLETAIPPDLPAVRGNQAQLQQVILNLMINGMEAMEASPDGNRTLAVSARPVEPGVVEVAVRDSGPGISPERLPRVFDDFYTTKRDGMGIGLSISRRIVEAHGGGIRAENMPGGGATLRVTLPVAGGSQ